MPNPYSQVFLSVGLKNAPEVYRSRREEHLKNLTSLAIYYAIEEDSENRINQTPEFLYLTGINQSGAILVLDPLAKGGENEHREILFLEEKNPKKEFWNGIKLGLVKDENIAEVSKITGFETILPIENFNSFVKKRTRTPQAELLKIHLAQRVILERERIKLAKVAQQITKEAFLSVLPKISELKNERTLSAFLDSQMLSRTDNGLSFSTICAAGKNACTLHYKKKDDDIKNGDLVLLDFGCRYNAVCSDISRTIPANGKFNPLQKLLYNIVLDTQIFHQKSVRAGLTLQELSKESWLYLETLLIHRFKECGGKAERYYTGKPHGISHLIGDIVHEGGATRDYLKKPLAAGMLISNEPGIYGHFSIEIDGIFYSEDIGIRIEDDLLITEKGCVNLSVGIPKTAEEIEELLS
ncbi:Xaa-Pro aminopeptidase [Fibrobacterales bacterium]|nr:Xaa-Pro aminopeptidase [Fibrobacterales bacterium]